VLESAEAIFQTYESSGGTAHYRTAMVLRQDPERPIRVDDRLPRFGPFLAEVGRQGRRPNSLELQPYDDLDDARRAAIGWVGENRPVAPEKVPMTVSIGIASVIRDPAVLPKYAP
jgi:hypothetical protein